MSSSSVEKIKEKLDVADVLGAYIKLEKAGANFKAKCPFHNEKTPSFFISPSRGTYYCFGCGAKGDIFTFVQEFEGVDFIGSLKLLAEKAGVPLEDYEPKQKGEKDSLLGVLEKATDFFEENLKKNIKALEYLEKRGLTKEMIKEWRIGYAPNEWRNLFTHMSSENISQAMMERVGLVKKSDKAREDGVYDVFRGRIIFPIFNTDGKSIAFSGRIFDDVPDAPKYLNSPETTLFNKSETLYGLHKAKVGIRKKDYSILVEGQMDLLMCHQAGFDNAVASSGTAFTEQHLLKLKRLSNRILFVFDADPAGFQAARKSASLALSLGLEVKLSQLPAGTDPADLILKDLEGWKEAVKNSKHLIEFYLDKLLLEKLDGRQLAKEVEKKILPYVADIQSSIEQSHFISQISKRTGIREEAIWNDLRKVPRGTSKDVTGEGTIAKAVEKEVGKRRSYIERRLYGILLWQEGEKEKIIDTDKLRVALISIVGDQYVVNALRAFQDEKEELVFEAEAYYGDKDHLNKELEELLINFEEDVLREKFVEAMGKLHLAESEHNEKETKKLLAVCQDLSTELSALSKKRQT
jgi:DNA primase